MTEVVGKSPGLPEGYGLGEVSFRNGSKADVSAYVRIRRKAGTDINLPVDQDVIRM